MIMVCPKIVKKACITVSIICLTLNCYGFTFFKNEEPDTPREVCVDGDLRLQGGGAHVFGNLSLQGRVEICLNNAWGTVCDRLFGEEELRTICNQIIGVTYQGNKQKLASY